MPMKKFINDPENLTAELLDGYVKAYSNKVALQSDKLVVRAQPSWTSLERSSTARISSPSRASSACCSSVRPL